MAKTIRLIDVRIDMFPDGDEGANPDDRDTRAFTRALNNLDRAGGGTLLVGHPGGLAGRHPEHLDAWELMRGVTPNREFSSSIVIQGVGNPLIRLTRQAQDAMFSLRTGSTFLQVRDLTIDVNNNASRGFQVYSTLAGAADDELPQPFRVRFQNVTVVNCRENYAPEEREDGSPNLDDVGERKKHASAAGFHVRGAYSLVEVLDCTVDGVTSIVAPYSRQEPGEDEIWFRVPVVRGIQVASGAGDRFCKRVVVRGGTVANVHHAWRVVGEPDDSPLDVDGVYVKSGPDNPDSSADISGVEFRSCQGRSVKGQVAALGVRGCTFHRGDRRGHIEVDVQFGAGTLTDNAFFYPGEGSVGIVMNASSRSTQPRTQLVATGNVIEFNPPRAAPEAGRETAVFQVWLDNKTKVPRVGQEHRLTHYLTHIVIQGNTVRGLCGKFARFLAWGDAYACLVNNVVEHCDTAFVQLNKNSADEPGLDPDEPLSFRGFVRNNASTGTPTDFFDPVGAASVDRDVLGPDASTDNLGFLEV